uniref:Uncharacterized protein n=1 Tax=Malurus cyaneus samueli TaxID=2593467 RepID=A0A8C5U337_9PASS
GSRSCGTRTPARPLVLILFLVCSGTQADPCWSCYQQLYYGNTQGSYMVAHTHINCICYDTRKPEICSPQGQTYWVAENLGWERARSGLGCPQGEEWIGFIKIQDLKNYALALGEAFCPEHL